MFSNIVIWAILGYSPDKQYKLRKTKISQYKPRIFKSNPAYRIVAPIFFSPIFFLFLPKFKYEKNEGKGGEFFYDWGIGWIGE